MGFGGLHIATSGLRVAQRNLNVTGHNIANSEVAGFSRQRIVQREAMPRSVGLNAAGRPMIAGMGADWSEVHQIRNEFLDINFRNNVSQLQFYSTKVQAGITIETLMGELHGAYSFQAVLNNIWFSIQELTAHPEGIATRQFFLSTANTFLTKAQEVFDGLLEYQRNLDDQIREIVNGSNGINATVAAIAEMNRRIMEAEAGGEMANDWRDERHRLLDHLATLVPIDVFHGPRGEVNITSLGHHLLTGTTQSPMGLRFIAAESSFVEPVFTHHQGILSAGTPPWEFTSFLNYITPIGVQHGNDRGRLMALLQARGTAPAHHLSADVLPPPTMSEVTTYLSTLPGTMPTDPFRYRVMYNFINHDPNNFVERIRAAYAAGDGALVAQLTDDMERHLGAAAHNHRAHMWSVNHAMIPQAQKNLDRIVNSVVNMINDALTGNLRDASGAYIFSDDGGVTPNRPWDLNDPPRPGIPLFIRYIDVDEDDRSWPLIPEENAHRAASVFTIANIRINPDFLVAGGHNSLALSLSGAPGDTDLLVALQQVWMSNDSFYSVLIGERRFNVQDAYIRFTGLIAAETAEAASKVTTQTIQVDQAQNMRMSIKGVSMDEELNAMLRFQFAFQAASRAFNMIDQMIDRLVNGTGRVGL